MGRGSQNRQGSYKPGAFHAPYTVILILKQKSKIRKNGKTKGGTLGKIEKNQRGDPWKIKKFFGKKIFFGKKFSMAKKANVIYNSTRLGELFPTPPCSFAYDYFKLNYSANYSRVFVLLTRYISRLTRTRQKKIAY